MGSKEQGADATDNRWLTIPRTLCFITHGDDVLLLKRSAHRRIFPGRYNGVGGHIERHEDPLSGALREIREETGLAVTHIRFCGVIHVDAGATTGVLVFVFRAEAQSRAFVQSDEGTLEWVPRHRIDTLPLVEDLPLLLDRVLDDQANVPFFAHTRYDDADNLVMRFVSATKAGE